MSNNYIIPVNQDVKWIGILDYDIVTFDIVMETQYGTTYNSYFIDAEKKTIIETAKEKFKDEYLAKVKAVCNPEEISYIILDHTEPDHSGSLRHLLRIAPNATVVGSGNAIRYLQDMVDIPFKSLTVKDGDTLSLGNKTLKFIAAPNLHWPDSIYTYLVEDKLLFTCDSFGAHFCHENVFDDLVPEYDDAFKYYFDVILKPYSKFMLKAIEKIKPLEIAAICTGHGPILRQTWKEKVELSERYAKEYLSQTEHQQKTLVITYISAYGYTKKMAEALAKGAQSIDQIKVILADIEKMELGEIDSLLTLADGLMIGSPTINQNTLLPVYRLFAVVNPIRDKGKLFMSFGSFGWSGEAAKIINATAGQLKFKLLNDGLISKFSLFDDSPYVEAGKQFAIQLQNSTVSAE
ncbi:MAG: FprA family A-type flavoprotein [Bacteroidales bacterium]|nr:FprA family A-type flavoprotein [Bacteroidales bacterium]